MIRAFILSLIFASIAHAFPEVESFESGVPKTFTTSGGKLSTTTEQLIDGKQALLWRFADGDAFVINTGPLGEINLWTGYGGYYRSSLTLPIYIPELNNGHLLLEIRAGTEVAGTVTIPFAHKGWQKIVYHYSWHTKIKWTNHALKKKVNNWRISAHGIEKPTYAVFDAILYNNPRDFRDACEAIKESWTPKKHDFSKLSPPSSEDLAKLDALTAKITPQTNTSIPLLHWKRTLDNIRSQITKRGYSKGNSVKTSISVPFKFLNSVANGWCSCPDNEFRPQIAAEFMKVNDWLQQQGLVVNGAQGKYNNYTGREYVDAITKMREPLTKHGTIEASLDYLKWSYYYDEQAFGPNYNKSMDYFHNEGLRILRIALAHADPVTRWHHVNIFRNTLGKQLVTSIKPDGAIFHHNFHYFAYGSMGMNSISGLLNQMSSCELPVSEQGLDSAKRAIMMMRWYSGRTTLWSLCGRNSAGTQNIPSGAMLNLGKAYAPYRGGEWDKELIAAYLRFQPQQADKPEFSSYKPEASPTGFKVMPYAALGMQRRDDWLIGIKGYSTYVCAGESYNNANCYGIFLCNGQLELLTHPKPLPTVHGSGTRPDEGYNWCAIDGTTSIHAPLERLANGNGGRSERSGEKFVGGLEHDGKNGLFVLKLNSGYQTRYVMRGQPKDAIKATPLKALKTWFFFDNRSICLGSDIGTSGVDYPVRTNLFQKFLTKEHATTVADGKSLSLTEQPITQSFSTGDHSFTDPYGNAYFTAAGDPVQLNIGTQKSRTNNDSADSTGDYATAWIDHGLNPTNASYEYAILAQADSTTSEAPAYTVLQKNGKAHIVRDHKSNTTGYVIFDHESALPSDTPLSSVSRPCLVMIEEHDDHLLVSLTNPDVRNGETEPQDLTISLNGKYTPTDTIPKNVTTKSEDKTIAISGPITHGESITIRLAKPKLQSQASQTGQIKKLIDKTLTYLYGFSGWTIPCFVVIFGLIIFMVGRKLSQK